MVLYILSLCSMLGVLDGFDTHSTTIVTRALSPRNRFRLHCQLCTIVIVLYLTVALPLALPLAHSNNIAVI